MSRPLEDILFGAPSPRAQTVNRALSVAAAAVQMNPSRITGICAARAARTAPQIAACSRPPSAASVSIAESPP